jgi:hypothetical protein
MINPLKTSEIIAPTELTILPYQPSDQPAFAALTHEWVTHHFGQLEPEDIAFSNDPERYIIAPGGTIVMARLDGTTVGTVGIQKMDDTTVELVRMSVTQGMQGHGIEDTEKGLMRQLTVLKQTNYSGCIIYTIPHN